MLKLRHILFYSGRGKVVIVQKCVNFSQTRSTYNQNGKFVWA